MVKISFNKRNKLIFMIIITISLLAIVFVNNNYSLYKTSIIKITSIKRVKKQTVYNTMNLKEDYYEEKIKGVLLNTNNKGQLITVTNESTTSNVVTTSYKVGEKVFIKDNKVTNMKRDTYVVYIFILFFISIFLVGKIKGLLAIVSVTFNTVIFCLSLNLYYHGINLILLCIIESIIFTIFSLVLNNGFNKKTKYAIISVFASLIVLGSLILITIKLTNFKSISFNDLNYITTPVEEIFTAELLIGGLGAIMDVCITIVAAIDEIINQNKRIKLKNLVKSGKQIGSDIMGTMTNVLLFTYLCSGLPLFTLAIRNGYTVYNYITSNLSLEITRFLTGGIGIILSIPISLFITIYFYKKEGVINE